MTADRGRICPEPALAARCRAAVERLTARYGWRLDHAAAAALVADAAETLAGEPGQAERLLEQTCCRLRFARLHAVLAAGGATAAQALDELYSVRWFEAETTDVRYGGYLFRSALTVLRRRLAGSGIEQTTLEQLAADAAARALTTVRARYADCRDADSFWGWTARVAERAAIDELRSGRATGGSSLRAASLDALGEGQLGAAAADHAEERQVDAIAVREELLRKCRLGKLSRDQREALVRSFWGGEKPAEIAAALSAERAATVTAAQVSLWKHRGLQVMEANLRDRGYGGGG
ncbi:MAG TPA: hypothetical protein VKV26_06255 [Dehalococcoidia bacterium]|nr:hypothetical protein [Dehalococcoidia bacterium]